MFRAIMNIATLGMGMGATGVDYTDRRPEHPNKRTPNKPSNPKVEYVEGRKRLSKRKLRRMRGKAKGKSA